MTQFAQRLVTAMSDNHMSVKDLSLHAGLSKSCVYSYLTQDAIPSAFTLECLADVLGVTMDWLWGRNERV